jgi:hypothetical protein
MGKITPVRRDLGRKYLGIMKIWQGMRLALSVASTEVE